MSSKKENNVTVGVRIRPLNEKERAAGMGVYFQPSKETNDVEELNEDSVVMKHWSYDHVYGEDSTNRMIFDSVGSKLVDAAIDGYNTVLFMYGQTSSGKTFTLFGGDGVAGLVDHSMEYLYKRIQTSTDTEFVVKLTYSELYNEELKDLLATTPHQEPLKIIDDPHLGPLIQNITEVNFTTPAEVKSLLDDGEKRRHFGVTNMNAHSSRSHVMVRVSIETRKCSSRPVQPLRANWGKDKPMCVSTLNLVDLAGSERANKSGTSGQALVEGSFINKSLLTLGTVISNLSEGKTTQHIPYRNSKLTRLLATALGGNAKTTMITCISPAQGNILESLSTLRFGTRTKRVVNMVQKNEIMSMKSLAAKLANQTAVIEQLRGQLELSRQLGFSAEDPDNPTESIKDKALAVSRNWRNLKFVLTNGPLIAQTLRGEGMSELAKKVRADVQHALLGSKDLSAIVDSYSDILVRHCPKERSLLQRLQQLTEENESDEVISAQEMSNNPFGSNGFLQQQQLLAGGGFGSGGSSGGDEELREELEQCRFGCEELRTAAVTRISQLGNEKHELSELEKKLKDQIHELQHSAMEKDESILRHTTAEANLQSLLEEQKKTHSAAVESSNQQQQQLMERLGQLELQLGDNESLLTSKNHEQLSKEAEIEKLRAQCEQLTNDLSAEKTSRKAFEEETARSRSEMRIQMDRLRNNMHEMLIQGGQEAKIMESHSEQMQRELDALKDFLELEQRAKLRFETEVQQLRAELAILREEYRSQLEAVTVSRAENAELTQKLRDARLENTRLTSTNAVLEQKYQKMQQEVSDSAACREEALAAQQAELRARSEQFDSSSRSLSTQLQLAEKELAAVREELEKKCALLLKIEQTSQSDLSRIEKKLAYQIKTNEEIIADSASSNASAQALHQRHLDDAKTLRQRIAELEGIVNSVNLYLEQQSDLLEPQQTSSVLDKYDVENNDPEYSYQGSAYVRRSSFMMEFDDFKDYARIGSVSNLTAFNRRQAARSSAAISATTSANSAAAATATEDDVMYDYPLVDSDGDASEEKNCTPQVGFYEDQDGNVLSNTLAISAATSDSAGSSPLKHRAVRNSNSSNSSPLLLPSAADEGQRSHSSSEDTSVGNTTTTAGAVVDADNFADSSDQFRRLLQGMNLITASLEHCCEEDRILRKFAMQQQFSGMEQIEHQSATISQLMERQEFLEAVSSNLQESLAFAKEKETAVGDQIGVADAEYKRLKEQHLEMLRAEHKSQSRANTLEQQFLDLKVQSEKMKLEQKQQAERNADLHIANVRHLQRVSELAEEVSVLQSQLQLSDQEMGVLRVERDEAMQRLKFKPAHSLTSTTPYNHHNNSSSSYIGSSSSNNNGSSSSSTGSRLNHSSSALYSSGPLVTDTDAANRQHEAAVAAATTPTPTPTPLRSYRINNNNSSSSNIISGKSPAAPSANSAGSGVDYYRSSSSGSTAKSPAGPHRSGSYSSGSNGNSSVFPSSPYSSISYSAAAIARQKTLEGNNNNSSGGGNGSNDRGSSSFGSPSTTAATTAALTYRPLLLSSSHTNFSNNTYSRDINSSNGNISSSSAMKSSLRAAMSPTIAATTTAAAATAGTPRRTGTGKYDYINDLRR